MKRYLALLPLAVGLVLLGTGIYNQSVYVPPERVPDRPPSDFLEGRETIDDVAARNRRNHEAFRKQSDDEFSQTGRIMFGAFLTFAGAIVAAAAFGLTKLAHKGRQVAEAMPQHVENLVAAAARGAARGAAEGKRKPGECPHCQGVQQNPNADRCEFCGGALS